MIIGFSRPKKFNLVSNLIRLWQGWTPYSHVFLMLEIEGRTMVAEASHGDVHLMSVDNFRKNNIIHATTGVVIDREQAISFIFDKLQKKYGFLTILKIFLGMEDGENDSYICSEFAAKVAKEYLPKDINLNTITPKQLYNLLKD